MGPANNDGPVRKTESPEGETAWPTPEYLVSMEGNFMEQESMSDSGNLGIRHKLFEDDVQNLLRISAGFDPDFDPKHAPRIALLCQTCHTALQTASYLLENETQSQRLTSEALRVRVWGTDILASTNCAPLDELLSLASGRHSSLQHHLTGVWADIAATLELVLFLLIRQKREPSREGCTQWRRLRIVLGLDDISAAIHDGFGLPGSFDSDTLYSDADQILDGLISSLGRLIDCLFDLIVTIGTLRQLYRLGFNPDFLTSTTFRNVEVQGDGISGIAAAGDSSASSSPANSDVSNECPLKRSESKISHLSESEQQDVFKEHSDRAANPSRGAFNVTIDQTKSVSQEDRSEIVDTTETSKTPIHYSKNAASKPRRDLSANTRRFRKPIKFIDCHARSFAFPFSLCRTWKDMQDLIKEGFQGLTGPYADATRKLIEHGRYDLVNHFDNETIIPSLWESFLVPGMTVRMVLYQIPPSTHVPPLQYSSNTQHTYQPYEYRPTSSQKATTPSSKIQERDNEYKEGRKSQDKDNEGHKDSQDDETTPTVSTGRARKAKASSSNVDATSSTQISSSEAPKSATVTAKDRNKKNQKVAPFGSESGDLRTFDEWQAFDLSRSAHLQRLLPSSSTLPNFEDLGVEKKARRSPVRPTAKKNSTYTTASTNYYDTAYNSMESAHSFYPRSPLGYTTHPNVSVPSSTELVPRNPLPYNKPVVTGPSSNPELTQPQYLDYSKAYSELKQMILDDKAVREARESAAKTLEDERRIKAEKEQFVAEQIAAAAAAAAANARLDFARKEAEKLVIESEKAEAEVKERAATAAAAANPEPIHLEDPIGRKFTFPYQQCKTWRGIDGLIKEAFRHVESIRSNILEGRYDLLSPNGDVLLPAIWESSIEPGWNVTMGLWSDGYPLLSNTSETQGLPNPDVEIITDPSMLDSQALSRTLSNRPTSPHTSAQLMHGSENLPGPRIIRTQEELSTQGAPPAQSKIEHIANPKNEAVTSHPSSEDEEPMDEDPENRRRISRWKHRILRPLRVGRFAATQHEPEDD